MISLFTPLCNFLNIFYYFWTRRRYFGCLRPPWCAVGEALTRLGVTLGSFCAIEDAKNIFIFREVDGSDRRFAPLQGRFSALATVQTSPRSDRSTSRYNRVQSFSSVLTAFRIFITGWSLGIGHLEMFNTLGRNNKNNRE